jgi:hypothetical protein
MEKIIVRNELLQRVQQEGNTLRTIKRMNVKFIVRKLRGECPLKHVTYGKIQGTIEMVGRQKGDVNIFRMSLQKRENIGNLWIKN